LLFDFQILEAYLMPVNQHSNTLNQASSRSGNTEEMPRDLDDAEIQK
jgi:hypothetical protein